MRTAVQSPTFLTVRFVPQSFPDAAFAGHAFSGQVGSSLLLCGMSPLWFRVSRVVWYSKEIYEHE